MLINYILAFGAVFVAATAQILLKKAADKNSTNKSLIAKFLNVKVIIGYSLLLISTIMNVFAFKQIDLKYANIVDATSLIWVTILAISFLGERPKKKKIIAIGLIIAGAIVFCL